MGRFIKFRQSQHGENGYKYETYINYKIQSEDEAYYYIMSDKIKKSTINPNDIEPIINC